MRLVDKEESLLSSQNPEGVYCIFFRAITEEKQSYHERCLLENWLLLF
jgi:hypothetical protein